MKLFVFVLNQTEKLEEILSAYVEADITGATVLDSVGMGHLLTNHALFAGYRKHIKGDRAQNKTIISVVHSDEEVRSAVKIIEEICGPLEQSGSGIAFTIPIDDVKGISFDRP